MLRIFTDFHHAALLQSLILLFEKRGVGYVYRPIGMEWAEKGFWKVYDHPATQAQYLAIGGSTPDGSQSLNEVVNSSPVVYECRDIDSGEINKAITFDGFMAGDFDVVIASLPQHIEPFRRLCDLHLNHPKLIYQIGNSWNIEPRQVEMVDAIMASAAVDFSNVMGKPLIQYHQEFDTDIFKPLNSYPGKIVSSFVNCFSIQDHFAMDWAIFQSVEASMRDWSFYCFGGQCRDGSQDGALAVAKSMQDSRFVWHTKNGGDGYGHVLHSAFACGRPVITRMSDYEGKMGGQLLIPDVTCIAIDGLGTDDIKAKIEHFSQLNNYTQMCMNVAEQFRKVVDFDAEAVKIHQFIYDLI